MGCNDQEVSGNTNLSSPRNIELAKEGATQTEKILNDPARNIAAIATAANMNGRLRAVGWASLFSAPADPSRNLSFLEPRSANSPALMNCDLRGEDLVEVAEEWKNALVGFFVGKRPHYLAVRALLSKPWKSEAGVEFEALHNGFFMFKFKSFEEGQRILEEGL